MSKKDISKILTSGSPKQRLQIAMENIARQKFGREGLITDHEANQLSNSFKTPTEIKLWNRGLKFDRAMSNGLMNLQGLKYETLMHISNLRGYILVWNTLEEAETLTNHILHEVKNKGERIKIASESSKIAEFLFTEIETDKEGYLNINIDFEREDVVNSKGEMLAYKEKGAKTNRFSLWYVMNNVRTQVITSAIRYLSWSKACEDFMEEEGFNIKMYKEIIKNMDEDIYKPVIGWTKYREDTDIFIPQIPRKRVDKLKSSYNIAPNLMALEIDVNEYNSFMNNFLRDE
jgi:hypothetical protein